VTDPYKVGGRHLSRGCEVAPVSQSTDALYAALGGHPGIRRAVDGFYERIASDPTLAGYFTGVDQARLRRHQVDLLAAVAGGPVRYTGRRLSVAHAGMNITNDQFDRVVGHLNAALVESGADDGTIRPVLNAVNDLRAEVVGY
jgi:hemoglobin